MEPVEILSENQITSQNQHPNHNTYFLPRVQNTSHETSARRVETHNKAPLSFKCRGSSDESPATHSNFKLAHVSVPSSLAPVQTLLREKDAEVVRLKHENALLKQIERRQQKEIEQLEWQSEERVIRALRDELAGLRHKLKIYFTQLSANAREIRHISEDRRRLRDQNIRLEKLIADRNLGERQQLSREVDSLNRRLLEQERIAADAVKRAELIEKNLTIDNRHLRSRVYSLEKDNSEYGERNHHLEEAVKDKEKEISSLYIYRYNAVHRKPESNVCKACQHREKEVQDHQQKALIATKLPKLRPPKVLPVSATSVDISYSIPEEAAGGDGDPVFSRLVLRYSTDSAMIDGVCTVDIMHPQDVQSKIMNSERNPTETTCDFADDVMASPGCLPSTVQTIRLEGLLSGAIYFFQLAAGHQDVEGVPTPPIYAVLKRPENPQKECLPARPGSSAPPAPFNLRAQILGTSALLVSFTCPRAKDLKIHTYGITIIKTPLLQLGDSSAPILSRLEIPCDDGPDDVVSYTYNEADTNCIYIFQVQAANETGWSRNSEPSTPVVIVGSVEGKNDGPLIVPPMESALSIAGIPLPPSPLPPTVFDVPLQDKHPPYPDPVPEPATDGSSQEDLSPLKSRTTSNLTLNQKIENMHMGMPAYYEPSLTDMAK
ncbi:hypothetical protein SpCBS45565_g08188 [Spizellomyces sp. 'palustris']|nr:hypothetical protein SpCBS45565_g08188 [Spizellomyces sp. 'palustris']